MADDSFSLARFVDAQEGVYGQALSELRAGAKRTHWMWFVFPQLRGLGSSAMARRYALGSLEDARAYLAHDVLGQRLREATDAALGCGEGDARRLFGTPDDLKFRSSMTLFHRADPQEAVFRHALTRFYDGEDARTLALLGAQGRPDRPTPSD